MYLGLPPSCPSWFKFADGSIALAGAFALSMSIGSLSLGRSRLQADGLVSGSSHGAMLVPSISKVLLFGAIG